MKKGTPEPVYGELFKNHYFEQYKMYIQSIEKISDRREKANKYFVTLNSGIIVAISFLLQHMDAFFSRPTLLVLLLLGVGVSIIFFFLINSYKQLNSVKFKLLHKIEKELPIRLYSREWDLLGSGKDILRYFPFSHIERLIPVVCGVGYFLAIFFFFDFCIY